MIANRGRRPIELKKKKDNKKIKHVMRKYRSKTEKDEEGGD